MGCGSSNEAAEADYQHALREKKQEEKVVQAR